MKHRAIVSYDPSALASLLHLPPDTCIIDARIAFDTGEVEFKVEHPQLPVAQPGERVMHLPVPQPTWALPEGWR